MIKRPIQAGFTIVEVLIVVSIVALLTAVGTIAFAESREQSRIQSEEGKMKSALQGVQNRSITALNGRAWGLRCENESYVEFSYSKSDPELDVQSVPFEKGFSCQLDVDAVRFNKLTGIPEQSHTELTLMLNGEAVSRIEIVDPGIINLIKL